MYVRHIIGDFGEELTKEYLLKNGYEIIATNFECREGEIDIVAKEKDEIVFIEVKTRTGNLYGGPLDAVNWVKKEHLIRTIKYYIYKNKIENAYIRIDVIAVFITDGINKIYHIKNAIIDI